MIYLIIILAFILRILNLNQSLWLDEAAQAIESIRPFAEQLQIKADFQPPLFHILLHFWMYLGKSEIWMRLLPVLCGILTVFFTYLLIEKLVNKQTALLTALLLAISPFHIWYSQELRPYALSGFLGILSTYYLIKNNQLKYIISCILFIYSTYFALFLLLAHFVYIRFFQKADIKQWLINSILVCLSFLPWLPKFIEQLQSGSGLVSLLPGWSESVSTPLYKALPLIFTKFIFGRVSFTNKYLYAFLVIGIFIIYLWLAYKSYIKNHLLFKKLTVFLIIPVIIAFAISFFLPIIAPQRLIFCLPFFYGLVACGVILYKKNIQIILITIFVLVSGYGVLMYNVNPKFQREQWRQAASFIENQNYPNSLVIFVFPDAFAPWQWYSKQLVQFKAISPNFVLSSDDLITLNLQINNYTRIYLFDYLTDLTDSNNLTENYLENLGFVEMQKKDFNGVGFITIYEKYLAKI